MLNPILAQDLSAVKGIRHGFFTRQGGLSEGIYASLNCGLGSKDNPETVLENRRRVAEYLGANGGHIVTLHQEHGATAYTVSAPIARAELPKADAIVSTTPGLAIGVVTADCAPILFADPEAKMVAAAHAGWRGAVNGVIESAIKEMERQGADRRHIHAAVGPCINQAAYEVGEEFEANLMRLDKGNARFFERTPIAAKPHFDLPAYARHRLREAGLERVDMCSPCTNQHESIFFSYRRASARRETDYGRQISAIVVA